MTPDPSVGKRAAAETAIGLVEDGMLLGLGTGSTVQYALEALGRRVRDDGLRVHCIPTSARTEAEARRLQIPLTDFAACDKLDLTIDGADEVQTGSLALIKGLGAALLREKIVARNSRRFVVIADSSKQVNQLGSRAPVPVEVARFAHEATGRQLRALGADPRLRMEDGAPLVTDGGNLIYDCHGFAPIADAAALDARIGAIVGVVETGLFPAGYAECAYLAEGDAVRILRPDRAP